jgi:hypothetical protein
VLGRRRRRGAAPPPPPGEQLERDREHVRHGDDDEDLADSQVQQPRDERDCDEEARFESEAWPEATEHQPGLPLGL